MPFKKILSLAVLGSGLFYSANSKTYVNDILYPEYKIDNNAKTITFHSAGIISKNVVVYKNSLNNYLTKGFFEPMKNKNSYKIILDKSDLNKDKKIDYLEAKTYNNFLQELYAKEISDYEFDELNSFDEERSYLFKKRLEKDYYNFLEDYKKEGSEDYSDSFEKIKIEQKEWDDLIKKEKENWEKEIKEERKKFDW